MSSGSLKCCEFFHQALTAGKEASSKPHQFPAPLLTQSIPIVCQLFHYLAVNLKNSTKKGTSYQVSQLHDNYTHYDQQEAKESFASPDYLFYGKLHIVELLYR